MTRLTFGIPELFDGISLVIVAMGLFGVTEVIAASAPSSPARSTAAPSASARWFPRATTCAARGGPILRGTGIGSFFGALPGTGGVIAAFMAYAVEKKVSKEPERFGKGAIEGIMAPEAANNAADQTAFIPTLTLGIPGNVIMALMIGALTIHGIVPGPQFMVQRPDMFWGLIMSFWIGNVLLLVLNIPLIGIWIRLLAVPYQLLYPAILIFVCIGRLQRQQQHLRRLHGRAVRRAGIRACGCSTCSRRRCCSASCSAR
jgi:putative tricarboxylic transport membrane protein